MSEHALGQLRNAWLWNIHSDFNNNNIPLALCSTWQSKPGEVGAAVEVALKEGYTQIDGAFAYMNEGEIGETLQKCFKEGVIKREDLFYTSKLWYYYTYTYTSLLNLSSLSIILIIIIPEV